MFKRLSFLAVMAMFFAASAQAIIWVDPYATIGFGTLTVDNADNESETGVMGYGLGVRGGVDFAMFFFGVDASYKMGSYEESLNVDGEEITEPDEGDISSLSAGLIAGISVPVLPLRVWVGYDLLDSVTQADISDGNNDVDYTITGSAIKAGLGFKVIPLIQLWVEYQMHTYTEYSRFSDDSTVMDNLEASDRDEGDLEYDSKNNMIAFGVSIPISL